MTTHEALGLAVAGLRAEGLDVKPTDPAMIVAHRNFDRIVGEKRFDPRFEAEGPVMARYLILKCYLIQSDRTTNS